MRNGDTFASAIAKYSKEKNEEPPILLLGTKAGKPKKKQLDELELQKRLEEVQGKIPRLKAQLSHIRQVTAIVPGCFQSKTNKPILKTSSAHCARTCIALQLVTRKENILQACRRNLPPYRGCNDLLTRLGSGFRPELDPLV